MPSSIGFPVCSGTSRLDLATRREEAGTWVPGYWNPKTETLGRDELAALQLVKLRRLSDWAAARSPFYQRSFKEAGFAPSSSSPWTTFAGCPC